MPVSLRSRSSAVKVQRNDDDDDDENEEIVPPEPKRRAKIKAEPPSPVPPPESRNVEEIRRKNLEDNRAFLEGLLMTKIRDDFKSSTHTLQPTVKKEPKKREVKFITVTENVPVRRSRRLANLDARGHKVSTAEESEEEDEKEEENQRPRVVVKRVYRQAPTISPEEQFAINEKIKTFFDHEGESAAVEKPLDYQFSDMSINDENVLKLTPDRLISMDMHPRTDTIAIIGCDRKGTIGLIAKSTNEFRGIWAKINYDFHSQYATCCYFDRFQSNSIHSTSYDATLRSSDMSKSVSTEIFKEEKGHGLTSFDYFSNQTLLVAEDNGDVLRLDMRSQICNDRYDLSKKRIRTLHINPIRPEEFCISGTEDCVKVYDLRQMSAMKYCLDTSHACYGAYYNLAGTHLIATTRDDKLMSFSCDEMAKAKDPHSIDPTKKVYHRNYVNRFVTPFRAQPYAAHDSQFLIGSHNFPRAITVIDENGQTVASLSNENLNSLAALNVAHRTLPIIAGGNSSGRVHIFTGQI